MRSWLQKFNKPEYHIFVSFWGPVGIAIGIICILNVFDVTAKSISFEPTNEITNLVNLVIGIVFFILGFVMSLLAQEKVVLARVGLTAGLSIFFWGTHVANIFKTGAGLGIGWGAIILGIVLLGMGFRRAPK